MSIRGLQGEKRYTGYAFLHARVTFPNCTTLYYNSLQLSTTSQPSITLFPPQPSTALCPPHRSALLYSPLQAPPALYNV